MKILKIGVGNHNEAFIEKNFCDGVNIISSDDNNKGKTIVIQSMMYALGNEPSFPATFEYRNYIYITLNLKLKKQNIAYAGMEILL